MRGHGKRRGWLVLAMASALLGGCVTRPTEYHEPPPLSVTERATLNARVFDRVWRLIDDKYFDANFRGVNWRALRDRYRPAALAAADETALYAVLNRMCAELKESHVGALAPRRAFEFQTDHRAAVGIRWQLLEGKRVVTDVVPGSPAARAGVQPGWIALSRNGAPLREGEVFVSRVGQPVVYGFLDARNEPRSFSLVPELLTFDRREARELGDRLLYLRFDQFSRQSLSWLSHELKSHADSPGAIIDLRQNSGGNAFVLSVALAEFFPGRVAEGRMVRRNGSQRESRSLSWLSAHYAGHVVLLTGPATASAAEIFAHVLQHHGRAEVVGRQTAGAVIFSRTYRLPDNGTVQIPVMDYVGLDGQRLEGHGVAPDRPVPPPSLADLRAGRDSDVFAAIAVLKESISADELPSGDEIQVTPAMAK